MDLSAHSISANIQYIQVKAKGYNLMAFYEIDSSVDFWHIVIPDYNLYQDMKFKEWLKKVEGMFAELRMIFCFNPLTEKSRAFDENEKYIVVRPKQGY